jgi:Ras GTPase-activating-like protein IQGAP2/3
VRPSHEVHFNLHLEQPEIQQFNRSSTGHLRTLSKFAQDGAGEDFTIKSKEQEVVGLHGRRRLQRTGSQMGKSAQVGFAGRTWMDTQRQYLAAYEYLCHIGEAKEWIEDIIQKSIPPIVQLEEALRDGITLAEVVQALCPNQHFKIFRGSLRSFRHSDNVAIFFRFLQDVELPELFWFEFVDLFEKKNIPKVIYCIHALSWLLWRKGITDFRIGNLVGQLQFEDHELEAMQKGLDRAGINMPNFSGMGANFGAEPEPEPVETEDERIDRELGEQNDTIADLQSQVRGAILRIQLGDTMQALWDSENWIVELQSKARGDMTREITQYRMDMRRFAVNLQSSVRGFLVRSRFRDEVWYWKENEHNVVVLQKLVRGRKDRARVQHIKSNIQRHDGGIRKLQAAIRGALRRKDAADKYEATREAESDVQGLQAAVRGALQRKKIEDQMQQLYSQEGKVQKLQSVIRGVLQRIEQQADRTCLRQQESMIVALQSLARAAITRNEVSSIQEELREHDEKWDTLQASIRGFLLRQLLHDTREELQLQSDSVKSLQARIRAFNLRHRLDLQRLALKKQEGSIRELQSASRGFILRQWTFEQLNELHEHEESIIAVQAFSRAFLCRSGVGRLFHELEEAEENIVELQTMARGSMVRIQFAEKMRFYKENMKKVIKIQSFVRGRQQGEAYKVLTSGKNPPVGTVKNFVHLLNDSDFDFNEEIGKILRQFLLPR